MITREEVTELAEIARLGFTEDEDFYRYCDLYDYLVETLRSAEIYVKFIKVDGSLRDMYCTRNSNYISMYYKGNPRNTEERETAYTNSRGKGLIKVYDTAKNDFRSFKVETILDYELIYSL